jgi:hypothetical protein
MTVATDRNLLFGPEYSMTRLKADRAGTNEQPSKRHRRTSQRLTNLKLNAAWVNLPIIRTQKLPIHIDRQCPAASCEIPLMPTAMSRNRGDFPGVLRSVDRRERPRSTSGTVVAFSLACLIKQYLIIGSISGE